MKKYQHIVLVLFVRRKTMKDLAEYINNLIAKDELWKFYKSKEWKQLRDSILNEYHNECAICKKRGIVTRYDIGKDGKKTLIKTVHHVKHVRKHPELALSRYYYECGERKENLLPVCKKCHNELHPEKGRKKNNRQDKFINEERW